MTTTPEFHRPQRIDMIGDTARAVAISADTGERALLAARFDLIAVDALDATFSVARDGRAIMARGRVSATVTQACIATGEPLPVTIDEPVTLRFVTEEDAPADDEVELSAQDCDVIIYTGSAIDLGDAAAETMMLALDPFPRGPNAEAALRAAGVKSEEEAGPFGALAGLKARLAGD